MPLNDAQRTLVYRVLAGEVEDDDERAQREVGKNGQVRMAIEKGLARRREMLWKQRDPDGRLGALLEAEYETPDPRALRVMVDLLLERNDPMGIALRGALAHDDLRPLGLLTFHGSYLDRDRPVILRHSLPLFGHKLLEEWHMFEEGERNDASEMVLLRPVDHDGVVLDHEALGDLPCALVGRRALEATFGRPDVGQESPRKWCKRIGLRTSSQLKLGPGCAPFVKLIDGRTVTCERGALVL